MTDWISAIVFIVLAFLWSPLAAAIVLRMGMTDDTQHRIDAALKRGIELGLEAAAKTVCRREIEAARELAESGDCHSPTEGRFAGLAEATDLIRALDPNDIIKEDDND